MMESERLKEAEAAVIKAMERDHQTGEERFNMVLLALYDVIQWAKWTEPWQRMLLDLHKAREGQADEYSKDAWNE